MNIPKDLPREELQAAAQEALTRYPGAEIYFKFTCQYCGLRCTLVEANTLYESGECSACGKQTPITRGGFMISICISGKKESA